MDYADTMVSMNMWAGYPDFLRYIDEGFSRFLDHLGDNQEKKEYLLPNIVAELLEKDAASVKVLETSDRWIGITYKEDIEPAPGEVSGNDGRRDISESFMELILYLFKERVIKYRWIRLRVLFLVIMRKRRIEKVVRDWKKELPEAVIYVYDNNSKDRTVELAEKTGAVVRHEYAQGKGNVIRRMFREIDAECYIMVRWR